MKREVESGEVEVRRGGGELRFWEGSGDIMSTEVVIRVPDRTVGCCWSHRGLLMPVDIFDNSVVDANGVTNSRLRCGVGPTNT